MAKGIAPSVREAMAKQNLEAAKIIAANPLRYSPPQVEWAEMVLAKAETPVKRSEGAK